MWFGLTQAQEREEGIDERIRNTGPSVSITLQFKAPWVTSIPDDLYKFSVREAFENLAGNNPNAVYYVFPLFRIWRKADHHSPSLINDTGLLPVCPISLAALTALSNPSTGMHRVEVRKVNSGATVTFHSPEVLGEMIKARDYFLESTGGQALKIGTVGIPSNELQEWCSSWSHLRFRGLNALFVQSG